MSARHVGCVEVLSRLRRPFVSRVATLLRVATDADLDALVDVNGGNQFAVASLACSISFTKRAL